MLCKHLCTSTGAVLPCTPAAPLCTTDSCSRSVLLSQVNDLRSSKPVRVRIAPRNSLLQRFHPDTAITTPVILSLDDDIYMTCRDLQKGFAAFKASPAQLVGYHPRLVEGQPPLYRWLWLSLAISGLPSSSWTFIALRLGTWEHAGTFAH